MRDRQMKLCRKLTRMVPSIDDGREQLRIDIYKSDQSSNADVVNLIGTLTFRQFSDTQASLHGRNVLLQY